MDYFHHYLETIHGFLESLVYIRVHGTFASHSSFHSFISVEPELSSVVFFLGPKPYHPTFSDILRKSFWRARTPPPLSKYLREYMIKKHYQIALLCTEGDPFHCVIASQTKYSKPLNLALNLDDITICRHMLNSVWFLTTDSGEMLRSGVLAQIA